MLFTTRLRRWIFGRRARIAQALKRRRSRLVLRRFEDLEERQLLSTMFWDSTSGGNWSDYSKWVNLSNPLDRHVPEASDDAIIGANNVSISYGSLFGSIKSLQMSGAGSSLIVSGGSLSISSTSSLAGSLVMTGGELTGNGDLTILGQTTWSGGTMSGAGVTRTEGGLSMLGSTYFGSLSLYLDQRTLENHGQAQIQQGIYLSLIHI